MKKYHQYIDEIKDQQRSAGNIYKAAMMDMLNDLDKRIDNIEAEIIKLKI